MEPVSNPDPTAPTTAIAAAVAAAQGELAAADPSTPEQALPHLRMAQVHVTAALDEAMAAAVIAEGTTIRHAASLAGLSENAVPPRLARTTLLAAYGDGERVTRTGVERARYDLEEGRHKPTDRTDALSSGDRDGTPPAPMRFRARGPRPR
jgi:hypothetical protein